MKTKTLVVISIQNSDDTVGNLKPFKPGQSGNPNGRPRKLPQIDKLIAEILGEDESGSSEAQLILSALVKRAKKGDTRAAEIILERAYGKAKQPIEHSGEIKGFSIKAASDKGVS